MNVGSILNNSDEKATGSPALESRPSISTHQRHSINNLLNGPPASKEKPEHLPDGLFRGSIADLTNDESGDVTVNSLRFELDEDEEEALVLEEKMDTKPVVKESPKLTFKELPRKVKAVGTEEKKFATASVSPRLSHLVDSELAKVKELKSAKKKPTRYTTPPIWAQEWLPPSQSNGYRDVAPSEPSSGGVSDKHVFNRTLMYTTDLECLITGIIPPLSVVRTIAEWLYANFVEIPLEHRQYVELELKFGTIMDKEAGKRLDIGVSTECIYNKSAGIHFDMGVHEVGWNDMRVFLEELEKLYQDENRKNGVKPKRKFNTLESDHTDMFFQINERNEKPKTMRITKDNTLNPPRYTGIHKKRISDLFIHNPSLMYDLRLSMSLELPIADGGVEPVLRRNKPTLTRGKKRTLWSHPPTVTQFDLTKVLIPKVMKNKLGKTVVENEVSFEVELEIDTIEIFKGFDKIRDGSDTIRFEELVEVFLNNARCLNNRVTKLASK